MKCLNGGASDDSADPVVLNGSRPFFDFAGNKPLVRLPLEFPKGTFIGFAPRLAFVSARSDVVLNQLKIKKSGAKQDYAFSFTGPDSTDILVVWKGVDVRADCPARYFRRRCPAPQTYKYLAANETTPLFGLNTDAFGISEPVLVYSKGTNPNAAGVTFELSEIPGRSAIDQTESRREGRAEGGRHLRVRRGAIHQSAEEEQRV